METTKVNNLLEQLKKTNARAIEINSENERTRGYVISKIEAIEKNVNMLKEQGYDIEFKLLDEVTIHPDTIAQFKGIYAKVYSDIEKQAELLEKTVTAVENKDYEAIKDLTGQDVSAVDYEVELADVASMKETVATATQGITADAVLSTGDEVEVLETSIDSDDDDFDEEDEEPVIDSYDDSDDYDYDFDEDLEDSEGEPVENHEYEESEDSDYDDEDSELDFTAFFEDME